MSWSVTHSWSGRIVISLVTALNVISGFAGRAAMIAIVRGRVGTQVDGQELPRLAIARPMIFAARGA